MMGPNTGTHKGRTRPGSWARRADKEGGAVRQGSVLTGSGVRRRKQQNPNTETTPPRTAKRPSTAGELAAGACFLNYFFMVNGSGPYITHAEPRKNTRLLHAERRGSRRGSSGMMHAWFVFLKCPRFPQSGG